MTVLTVFKIFSTTAVAEFTIQSEVRSQIVNEHPTHDYPCHKPPVVFLTFNPPHKLAAPYLLELELDDLLLRLVRDLERDRARRGGERRRMGGLRGGLYLGGEGRPHLGGGPLLGGGLRLMGLTGGRGGSTVAAVTS